MAEETNVDKKAGTPPAASEAPANPRRKKIKSLTLAEIEEKIAQVKENQGGFTSRYARQLLHRKKILTASK
ncbi:MAG TPA: hypothetical protein PLX50_03070 [Candidatus Aminicenantes bacterium]|nr:hypothetical protein [Candidatus Aminicenantes bacterium]